MKVQNLNSVLVPVDFSEESIAAVDVALKFAAQPSGVLALHVLPELSAMEPGMIWETVDNQTRCQHALEALRNSFGDAKYRDLRTECVVGDPGHSIVDQAERANAELIVMPSHGRRGLSRILLGSVAERVLRLADCDVLVLKPGSK